jgi:hypothetical protein
MNNKLKLFRFHLAVVFAMLLLCSAAFSQSVHVNITCSSGGTYVYVSAYATPGAPFGQGEMDLDVQGPYYTHYQSTSGMSYLSLSDSPPFYYDSGYTATACAYFEDDYGYWYSCDTDTCITQIEPTLRSAFFDEKGRLKTR